MLFRNEKCHMFGNEINPFTSFLMAFFVKYITVELPNTRNYTVKHSHALITN